MNTLFRNQPQETEQPKKKVRGKPFTKDDPRANKLGRPKLGVTLAAKYRDALAEAENDAKSGEYTKLDKLIDILMKQALAGDLDAIKYLNERAYGKVPDKLELSRGDEEPQQIDLSHLTDTEMECLQYLTQKINGNLEYMASKGELYEYAGTEKRYYRYVLAKEYTDTPELIEGTIKE